MGKISKFIWVLVTGISGLLLTLAGYNLIDLSSDLIRYTGLSLLGLSLIFWIIPGRRKEVS